MENFEYSKKSESKNKWLVAFLFALLVLVDQLSKAAAGRIFLTGNLLLVCLSRRY